MNALAVALVVGFSSLTSVTAHAADILAADPRINDGRLIITGVAAAAGMHIRLDGQTGAAFNVTSDAGATGSPFAFDLLYLPSDCIVTLQKVTGSTLGPPSTWPVSDCGPRGVTPRGAWNASAPYLKDDLVTAQGSTWRAKRDNTNSLPAAGKDWEQFAAKGATGSDGPQGPPGPRGQDAVFTGQRLVAQVCDENGGWVTRGDHVYCIARCAVGEVAFGGSVIIVLRSSGTGNLLQTVPSFTPAGPPQFPRDKWYTFFLDTNDGNGHGLFSRQTVRILCEAP